MYPSCSRFVGVPVRRFPLAMLPFLLLAGCSSTDDHATGASLASAQIAGKQAAVAGVAQPFDLGAEISSDLERLRRQHNVFFHYDSTELPLEALDVLDAHGAYLVANPDVRVAIEGHADDRGDSAYNADLSKRRADAVAAYLRRGGVKEQQLIVRDYGETRSMSVYTAETWFGHPKNRRVDLIY